MRKLWGQNKSRSAERNAEDEELNCYQVQLARADSSSWLNNPGDQNLQARVSHSDSAHSFAILSTELKGESNAIN